jgi:hypothetical protein
VPDTLAVPSAIVSPAAVITAASLISPILTVISCSVVFGVAIEPPSLSSLSVAVTVRE